MNKIEHRPLYVIAQEITEDWRKPYFGAVPYLSAMRELDNIGDKYMADTAVSVVSYFLANASQWKGDNARRIKTELRGIVDRQRKRGQGSFV